MLDYTKVTFNELDDTDKPLQVFYNYDLEQSEIDDLLRVRNRRRNTRRCVCPESRIMSDNLCKT